MSIGQGEFEVRITLLSQMNMTMVMDQARADRTFLDKLITGLEARDLVQRSRDEKSLLQWASAMRRLQGWSP